jgi:hypothetical protein
VEEFKYLETKLTNQNSIEEEIKSRLNSGHACYNSVQKLFRSGLQTKNVNSKTYTVLILPLLLHGCKTWSDTLREEHGLRMLENEVLRIIFGPKRDEVTRE